MEKIEIQIPKGKEIDWQESAKQKQIVLKNKQFTYEDVCEKLFKYGHYYIDPLSGIHEVDLSTYDSNAATTKHQLECILAKNRLANVARYLNGDWKPNLKSDYGYGIALSYHKSELIIDHCAVLCMFSSGKVIFKFQELARQAIEILGEETVKLALEPLY